MVQVTVAVAVVELGLLGLIIRQVSCLSPLMRHGLFSLSCHRHKILENLAYVSRMIFCIIIQINQYSIIFSHRGATEKFQCKQKIAYEAEVKSND